MSIAGAEKKQPKFFWPGTIFSLLLLLSLFWPSPVLWLNRHTINVPLGIHEDSFLGREAPSWDAVFWGLIGIFALALIHARLSTLPQSLRWFAGHVTAVGRHIRSHMEEFPWKRTAVFFALGATAVAITWIFFDPALIRVAESLQTDATRDTVRILNRLGGGMNPPLIAAFFLLIGIVYTHARSTEIAICMVLAGATSGVIVTILKQAFGRARPELWLGAFHHTWPSATSFPSGHTVGAFALASVVVFGARSIGLRITAGVLALAIAAARVFAFRHWPSDVLASALLGTVVGWFFTSALVYRFEAAHGDQSLEN